MSVLLGLRHRMHALLFPRAHARDVEEEMRLHLDLDSLQQGVSHDATLQQAARREATLRFGNRTYYREEVRRMSWYGSLDGLRQDLRYAFRGMRRNPGVTCAVVLTLALGIGINAATFTLIDLLFLQGPAGVHDASPLRRLYVQHFRTGDGIPFYSPSLSYPQFQEVAAVIGDSSNAAIYTREARLHLGTNPRAPIVRGVYASSSYFSVLGVRPVMGRVYNADEDRLGNGAPVIVVSHRFWRQHLAADTAAIGRAVKVDADQFTVIGVLDDAFGGTELQADDVWIPLANLPQPTYLAKPWWIEGRNMIRFSALYRHGPGVPDQAIALRATQRLRALDRLGPYAPDTLLNVTPSPITSAGAPGEPQYQTLLASRLAAVSLIVLIIACANVVNLLLARANRRRHEFSIRIALGVSPARLMRMLTTEALLLAMLATVPAVIAAGIGGTMLRTLLMPEVQWYTAVVGWRVVVFAFVIAMLAGFVAGVIPALQYRSASVNDDLKVGARGGFAQHAALRRSLVIVQTALSLLLLTGAALFWQSLRNVQALRIGYDADRLLIGTVSFTKNEGPPAAVLEAALTEIGTRMLGRAGVTSTSRAFFEPMRGLSWMDFFTATDSSGAFPQGQPTVNYVSKGFFRTVGTRLVRGHDFDKRAVGNAGSNEVIVNEAFAARLWPGQNAVGQCMHLKTPDAACHTVIAVVENARQEEVLEAEPKLQFYVLIGSPGIKPPGTTLLLRVEGPTALAERTFRELLTSEFPSGLPEVHTMTKTLEPQYRRWRLGATLFSMLGGLALIVSIVGIYSTISYGVSQRTHEFGVRIAMGAQLPRLLWQVLRSSILTVVWGLMAGVALVVVAGRLITELLYSVGPRDPWTIGAVSCLLLAVAALASLVPAWRAAHVDPLKALRAD